MKKLNIGCGNVPLKGYYNIDKYYYPDSDNPYTDKSVVNSWVNTQDSIWMFGDATTLPFFEEKFDKIIMVHALEHMCKTDGEKAIKEAFRVLKKGGQLEIEVPDLIKACKLFLKNGSIDRTMGLFYGSQGKEGEGQFHLFGYSKDSLKGLMSEGVENIEEIPVGFGHGDSEDGHAEPEYDFRLRGIKP